MITDWLNKIVVIELIISFCISAQDSKSIHRIESEYYSKIQPNGISVIKSPTKTRMQKNSGSTGLIKTVFGFLPWWEYYTNAQQNLKYNLLTHLAVFSFEADSLGNLKDPIMWPWIDVINQAFNNNVKVLITVTNFNPKEIHKLFVDTVIRNNLFQNIHTRLQNSNLDGVIIDFENIDNTDIQSELNNFLSNLRKYLNQFNSNYEISFATPVVNNGDWNFVRMLDFCNYLFIMGYDFYGSWSSTTGPSAPLTGGFFNLTKSLNEDYSTVPSNKLILGVPYYGNYWKTNSKDAYTNVTPYDSMSAVNNWVKPALRYKEILSYYNQKEKMFDNLSQTPWLRWQDTTWNQIWYDDSVSLELKYNLVINKNLKGIGIWALGYDDGRNELWNLIKSKFVTTTDVKEDLSNFPAGFKLYQNYPNPFNPSTVISWQLEVSSFVNLKIYDMLGREIATLVNEYQQAGNHYSTFSIFTRQRRATSTLSSGIYFYTLRAGNYVETKKMILVQ